MADLPLIAWDEVPEGPVWVRAQGEAGEWHIAKKREDGALCLPSYVADPSSYDFCAAEPQPGGWAAELASLRFQISEISARAAYKAVVLLGDPDGNTTRLKTVVVSGSPDEVRIHVVRPHAEDERSSDDPLTAARLDSMRKRWKDTESELARLRDGLAALEQDWTGRLRLMRREHRRLRDYAASDAGGRMDQLVRCLAGLAALRDTPRTPCLGSRLPRRHGAGGSMTFTLPEIIARMNWIGAQTDETRARLRDGCERTRHVPTGERLMTNPPIDTCWVCGQEFREGRAATEAEQ